MDLTNSQRLELRQRMLAAFEAEELKMFLSDRLDLDFDHVVPAHEGFEYQCHRFILWAQRNDQLMGFLQAVQAHHTNPALVACAAGLLAACAAPAAGAPARIHMVCQRPLLDRVTFWQRLRALASGADARRVFIVTGGVGKSYSRWPVSEASKNVARTVKIDASVDKVVDFDAVRLAGLIEGRLAERPVRGELDELAQAPRLIKDLLPPLLQQLAQIKEPTWLIVDELDQVNLDASALELLSQLCEAIEGLECPQVWLFLIGLNPARLIPRVRRAFPPSSVDEVRRPARQDIEAYLVWFASTFGKSIPAPALAPLVDGLDALLLPVPDYASWEEFHKSLRQTCSGIEQGTLP